MKKIIVMGSFVVDLMGRADHLPVPGETVKGNMFKSGPGGKGSNQAVAAKRMGADVRMATKIGEDDFGEMALNNFMNEGFDTELIFRDPESATGAALILVDENTSQNSILVTLGACEKITADNMRLIKAAVKEASFLLTQLETNINAVEEIVEYASTEGKTVVLNPAPVQEFSEKIYKYIDIFTPNEVEAGILAGMKVENENDADKAADYFMSKGVKNVLITMGEMGVFLKTGEGSVFIPAYEVDALDTTGAGDAYNGGLVAALAEGRSLEDAALVANAVAALSVTKLGTAPAMPYKKDVMEFINNSGD